MDDAVHAPGESVVVRWREAQSRLGDVALRGPEAGMLSNGPAMDKTDDVCFVPVLQAAEECLTHDLGCTGDEDGCASHGVSAP